LTSSVDTCEAARVIRCPIADLHSLPHTFSFIIPHRKGFGINTLSKVRQQYLDNRDLHSPYEMNHLIYVNEFTVKPYKVWYNLEDTRSY